MVLTIFFPTAHLIAEGDVPSKAIEWLDPARPNETRSVELAFTNESEEDFREIAATASRRLIRFHRLAEHHEESLAITTAKGVLPVADLILEASHHERDDFVFPAAADPLLQRTLRLSMYYFPKGGDGLACQELSGFRLPRGQARALYPHADSITRDKVLANIKAEPSDG